MNKEKMADLIFEALVNVSKVATKEQQLLEKLEEEVERLNQFNEENRHCPEFDRGLDQ